jgi:2-polyprenyl-3-methyl-5-hydroxy-6-metoxy-1,4-benzoquinol methylase
MACLPSPDDERFIEFATRLRDRSVIEALTSAVDLPLAVVSSRIELAIGEAAQTLRLVSGVEVPLGARLLEVGAGLGVTSHFLSSVGYDVTALEPGGIGFELHAVLAEGLASVHRAEPMQLRIGAESLNPATHGTFDVVFSNNVMEHISVPSAALRGSRSVTSDGGWCIHSCPNYHVPFEPHFGLPLVPFCPKVTGRLLPARIRNDDVWTSLNFLTSSQVRRIARSMGCDVHFRPAALAASVERLVTDQLFAERHPRLASVARIGRKFGVVAALRHLPVSLSTPMHFALMDRDTDHEALERWRTG